MAAPVIHALLLQIEIFRGSRYRLWLAPVLQAETQALGLLFHGLELGLLAGGSSRCSTSSSIRQLK